MTDVGLTLEEVADIEDLFGPANLREIVARAKEMRQARQPGRVGLFSHMNGRGEVTEHELVYPPRRRKALTA